MPHISEPVRPLKVFSVIVNLVPINMIYFSIPFGVRIRDEGKRNKAMDFDSFGVTAPR
jgi:hypothetical protein